ncbi:MAG: hydrolase [Planctomycetes bacterium SCN 63-9]|nr:MAG: hydrolase [Planctomycetes bacterium SCN 63-9]
MRITQRLTASHGALLVIDMQDKLLERTADHAAVLTNTVRLIDAANLLKLPAWATEQYPKGLGATNREIAERIPDRPSKTTFHCCATAQLIEQLYGRHIKHVTLAGIEAHVCVAQTALELMDMNFRVQVVADAVASRNPIDREYALRRLERAGAIISTTEAVIFEWTETADRPEFKAISALIKAASPAQ